MNYSTTSFSLLSEIDWNYQVFFIFKGRRLYNLTPIWSTMFWTKDVLRDCVWRSYLLLLLCSWISQLCFR